MVELDIGRFIVAFQHICATGQLMSVLRGQGGQAPVFGRRDWEELEENAKAIAELSAAADLQVTAHAGRILVAEIAHVSPNERGEYALDAGSLGRIAASLTRVQEAAKSEAATRWFLSLSMSDLALWKPEGPVFGDEVEGKFPGATYEIEEAAKCLALGRGTAAVFHLMRAMEGAVQVLGVKLSATVVSAGGEALPWGIILGNIKPKIDALPGGPGRDEWYVIHALLHSVNRAFRTKTAHPAKKYTEEEARNAFAAAKAFLQEMAERCA